MDEKEKREYSIIATAFVFIILEIGLIWGTASELRYLIDIKNDSSGYFVFIVVSVFFWIAVAILTASIMVIRAEDVWKGENCTTTTLGFEARLWRKSEVLIISCLFISTLAGVGVWDMVIVITALVDNGWDFSIMTDNYLFFDFVIYQLFTDLWIFLVLGLLELIISIIAIVTVTNKIKDGTFCEVDSV